MTLVQRVVSYVRMHGGVYTLHRAVEILLNRIFHHDDRQWRREAVNDAELARQRANQPDAGLISVAVPVYNTRPAFLCELAASLKAQTYANWEAVLYDGCSTAAESVAAMDAVQDDRIHIIHGKVNAGISGNTNLAIASCRGEYVALCDHDDVLSPDALWRMAEAIAAHHPDMLYSDEDKLTEDGRFHTDPHHKPDFCPDNLRSGNYICHLMVIRRALITQVGGLRPAFDGSQDHDLALRVSEVTDKIAHIPRTLYHWRTVRSSMSHQHLARCQDAAARAVTEHMQRIGYPGVSRVEDGVLRLCYETPASLRVKRIDVPQGEGYAYMNRAALEAEEEVLLFVHASVQGLSEGFERELLMYAQRDDVGAVTPMLTNARGHVTHAGFAWRDGRLVCRQEGLPWHAGGWHGMNRTSHNVMAVSGACLMIRRDHFIPFDESWTDGLGMADWCLQLRKKGLRCVYTPHACAVCTEAAWLSRFWDYERFAGAHAPLRDECSSAVR